MTPEGSDKVPEQRQQGEAKVCVLAVTPAQVSGQRCREGLRDANIRLRLLEQQEQQTVSQSSFCWVDG